LNIGQREARGIKIRTQGKEKAKAREQGTGKIFVEKGGKS